jgi:DUF4097 and DUF4098 domain-containing protein YvlB
MRKLFFFLTVAAIAPLQALAVDGAFHWTGRLGAGQEIEIKNINGAVRAEYTDAGDVQVDATKSAKRSDPNSVQIEAVPHGGGVTICAVYPSVEGRSNECKPGNEGRMNTRDNDVHVEFTVKVPRGVRLAAKTVNGDVVANGLHSEVDAATVNGKVDVSSTELVRAKTVNGSINAKMGASSWNGELRFETVNGSVDITMPPAISADVKVSTVNGGISTDFPLTVTGKWGPKNMNGRIGSGGRDLSIKTVNGGINLHSSSGRTI